MGTETINKLLPNNFYISLSLILITIPYCSAFTCSEGRCIQQCTDLQPCTNAIIDFSQATEGSLLTCESPNTCINVTLICPDTPNTNIPCNAEPCYHNCEIRGHGGTFESHSNWTIYAPNSWNDLTITNFNAYIEGTMFCNDNYSASCPIQYGLWNCQYDPSNECFMKQDNEYYVNCTTDQQCKGETLSCPDIAEGENEGICNVICSGQQSCADTVINCGKRRQCNVLCTGEQSCYGEPTQTKINCGSSSYEDCTIICGDYSCMDIAINADNYDDLRGNLNVNAMGTLGFATSILYGPAYADVNIQCNGIGGCNDAVFDAKDSVELSIGCNSNGESCMDMHVYCPTQSQDCFISGTANDIHNDLSIYARGGWNDLSISSEYKTHSTIDTTGNSKMSCGSNYDEACLINEDWYCDCPPFPTVSPSNSPTLTDEMRPTIAPTDESDELSDRQKNGYIVGGVFVGFVICCFCGVFYWYCCVHHKAIDKDKKYESVKAEDDKMDDKTDIQMQNRNSKKGVKDEHESKEIENNDDIKEEENRTDNTAVADVSQD